MASHDDADPRDGLNPLAFPSHTHARHVRFSIDPISVCIACSSEQPTHQYRREPSAASAHPTAPAMIASSSLSPGVSCAAVMPEVTGPERSPSYGRSTFTYIFRDCAAESRDSA